MIDQPPQIPPAVVKFAEDNGYKVTSKNDFWGDDYPYKDYKEIYNAKGISPELGIAIILVKGNKIRFATSEETIQLIQVYY